MDLKLEKLKEHWPKIAVGIAAICMGYAAYKSYASESVLVSKEGETQWKKGQDNKSWPVPRKVISESDSAESQREKLFNWLDKSLKEFFDKHGSFKFDNNNNLNEEDFLRIYDLIESVGRFELK